MDYRARRLRTTLVLGTAFLAGVIIGPASGLIARHFVGDRASAPRSPRTSTGTIPTGYSLFLAMCSSGRVVNTSSQSPTRT